MEHTATITQTMEKQATQERMNLANHVGEEVTYQHIITDLTTFVKYTFRYDSMVASDAAIENMKKAYTKWEEFSIGTYVATETLVEKVPGYIYNGKKTEEKRFLVIVERHVVSRPVHTAINIHLDGTPLEEVCLRDYGITMNVKEAIEKNDMKSIKWICRNVERVDLGFLRSNAEALKNSECWKYLLFHANHSQWHPEILFPTYLAVMDESMANQFDKFSNGLTTFGILRFLKDVSAEKLSWIAKQWSTTVSLNELVEMDITFIKALYDRGLVLWNISKDDEHRIFSIAHVRILDGLGESLADVPYYLRIPIRSIKDAKEFQHFVAKGWKLTPIVVSVRDLEKNCQYSLLKYLIQEMKIDLHSNYFGSDDMKRMLKTGDFTYVVSGDPKDLPAEVVTVDPWKDIPATC